MMRMRDGLAAAALAGLLSACGGGAPGDAPGSAAASGDKTLFVYNWSDYIAPDTIPNFEARTGIKVTYDVFDSNEVLETKLLTGRTGYDVVVPSASFLERQVKAGVFMPLDRGQLPNWDNLDEALMRHVARHDPGNRHAVPYLWGTTGIGYNPDKVAKALGDVPVDSWAILFDPANARKLAGCGIALLDAPGEVIDVAQVFLGRDPNSEAPEDLATAEALLMQLRPHVRYFHSSRYIEDLANGEICIALGWSGDILQARDRGAAAANPVPVRYAIPKEGSIIWFDMLAIPDDAPHPANAHAFINYLLEPAVIAAVSNHRRYASGNAAARELVDEAVRNDPGVYPPPEVMEKLHPHLSESLDFSRNLNRAWTRIRTGQ